ncbi:MAG: A/G-specific adenine glycosylase [Clostridia bacterium]|nr:A/G-specific adenine glycosylase [Clostridia bacterium]
MPTPLPPAAVPLLIDWYRQNRRDLPWRESTDPYRVLVSEIMLQQTRAETVKPYFHRFLATLPTVEALANADESTLLKLWEGLGYYSRVRNLQKAAKAVMEHHGGVIPADFDALLKLPGVGRYTAGAVASIAFGIPVPAVDGNVLRVLARLTGDDTDILSPTAKKTAEATLAPLIPADAAGDFTQSLIELGALVCVPGEPKCRDCPLHLFCTANREGKQTALPVRLAKTKRRIEERTVLVIRLWDEASPAESPRIALRKRPPEGLLGGLYEFPCLEGHATSDEVSSHLTALGLIVTSVTPLPPAKHLFSHIEWRMIGYAVEAEAAPDKVEDWFFAGITEPDERYAIPSAYGVYREAVRHGYEGSTETQGQIK